jgi:alpha-L-fucosidase
MAVALVIALLAAVPATPAAETAPGNQPQRLEWFRDLGFGIFIHWSVDSQIGSVISHSLVGADADYRKRFFDLLPRSFDPTRYCPQEWASLVRLAGRNTSCSPRSTTPASRCTTRGRRASAS